MIGNIPNAASILTLHILYSLYLDYVRLYSLYVFKIGQKNKKYLQGMGRMQKGTITYFRKSATFSIKKESLKSTLTFETLFCRSTN